MTRRKRGSLTAAEILDGSLGIIQEEGIENLSMRRIAQRLNCSVASPYAYFRSREEIIKELILSGERKLTQDLRHARASAPAADPFDPLVAIAHTYWDFALENKELHKLMVNQGGNFYRRVFVFQPTSYRVFLDTVRAIVKTQGPEGRRRYSAVARTMWAWIYGLIVLEMNGMLKKRKNQDYVAEGVALFRRLLRMLGNEAE